jgi:hypothetical protein
MLCNKKSEKSRLILSLVLSIATLGTTLGTAERASALPLIQGLIAPIGSLLTGGQQRPPTPDELQLMNGNLNNNSFNLCALTCGPSAGASGMPSSVPAGVRPPSLPGMIPGGQMISGGQGFPGRPIVPGGQVVPGRSPYPIPPQAGQGRPSNNPVLQLPPIQLPNPF